MEEREGEREERESWMEFPEEFVRKFKGLLGKSEESFRSSQKNLPGKKRNQ